MLKEKIKKINKYWLIPLGLVFIVGVYFLPPVRSRLEWRLDALRTQIIYFFNPPSEAVFQPSEQNPLTIETALATARAEMALTLTPASTPTVQSDSVSTPTITPEPPPTTAILDGITFVDQKNRWNYCGPSNLTMMLNFWGWKGNRDDVAKVIKPGSPDMSKSFIERGLPDKNVMPYELVDFVNEETEYRALYRYGGNIEISKRLIAAGFPVIVEQGYYDQDNFSTAINWIGHYLLATGYDDARSGFIVQDTNPKLSVPGKDLLKEYGEFLDEWRSFNYIFIVVYPPDREAEVLEILGPWVDFKWAAQHALEMAERDIQALSGNDRFFAWFNKGTSHVLLSQYVDAASAYDQAFREYANWDDSVYKSPYRMVWYQTGPYFAYYYSARYQDVIGLANVTLTDPANKTERTLEESLLWRGRAYYMIGNTPAAIADYRAALQVHMNWFPAVQALQELGVQP